MRRRGKSPWLIAEQNRILTEMPPAVARSIADDDTALAAWRLHRCHTIAKLARLAKIPSERLYRLEQGAVPHPDELAALAAALKIIPELLAPLPVNDG